MSDIEKARIQREARRTVASRTTALTESSEGIIRRLGAELYKEQHRTEHPHDHETPADEETTDGSSDR